MAHKCQGHSCPYGYGHHAEHVAAARLGWRRRREGEAQYIGHVFGGEYELHSHEGHFIARSVRDDSHFELSREEYRQLAAQRQAELREAETERRFQREVAKIERAIAREHRPQQLTLREGQAQLKAYQRAKRDAERLERHRTKELAAEQRLAARFRRDELYAAIRTVSNGKIRGFRGGHEAEEARAIPAQFRARRGEDGLAPDDLAAHLSEHAPWLNIHNSDDLFQAFNALTLQRTNRKAA